MKGVEAVLGRKGANATTKAYLVQQFTSQVNVEMDKEIKNGIQTMWLLLILKILSAI